MVKKIFFKVGSYPQSHAMTMWAYMLVTPFFEQSPCSGNLDLSVVYMYSEGAMWFNPDDGKDVTRVQ